MAVTLIDLAHAAAGDLLVWVLPVDQSAPQPGATLLPGVGRDDLGREVRAWWCRYGPGEPAARHPAPTLVVRDAPLT